MNTEQQLQFQEDLTRLVFEKYGANRTIAPHTYAKDANGEYLESKIWFAYHGWCAAKGLKP